MGGRGVTGRVGGRAPCSVPNDQPPVSSSEHERTSGRQRAPLSQTLAPILDDGGVKLPVCGWAREDWDRKKNGALTLFPAVRVSGVHGTVTFAERRLSRTRPLAHAHNPDLAMPDKPEMFSPKNPPSSSCGARLEMARLTAFWNLQCASFPAFPSRGCRLVDRSRMHAKFEYRCTIPSRRARPPTCSALGFREPLPSQTVPIDRANMVGRFDPQTRRGPCVCRTRTEKCSAISRPRHHDRWTPPMPWLLRRIPDRKSPDRPSPAPSLPSAHPHRRAKRWRIGPPRRTISPRY